LTPAVLAVPLTRVVFGGDFWLFAGTGESRPPRAELVNVPRRTGAPGNLSFDSLAGYSGRLRARMITRDEVASYPFLAARFGASASAPGIRSLAMPNGASDFSFITLKPWRDKLGSFINTYHVGFWPGERKTMPANYTNPAGFIEVSRDLVDLRLSQHFTLRDFITHDQERVWPKYVVLREELLDKLELVLTTLEAQGVPTRNVVVLSGFRTPQYNLRATFEGAAYASRHQYGDAADVIIDADRDGRMDDLNGDGAVNFRDTDVINRAVERVEKRYPDLVGGLGLYHAMGPSGPFAHIDVRGTRARWTNGGARSASRSPATPPPDNTPSVAVGKCRADAEFAALCGADRR
jgi:hypothetical protein